MRLGDIVDREIDIKTMIEGITPENVHPEVDWGQPVGREFGGPADPYRDEDDTAGQMTALEFSLDPEVEAGYITYQPLERVVPTQRDVRRREDRVEIFPVGEDDEHDAAVVLDVDPNDEQKIYGVEFLSFDDETLALLRDVLRVRRLEEPLGLAAALESRRQHRRDHR